MCKPCSTLIAITHHNHYAYTNLALKSLILNTDGRWHCIIYDDGSDRPYTLPTWVTDEDKSRFTVLRNETPVGVNEAWSDIYDLWRTIQEEHEYLVISNNDVIFTRGWLPGLMSPFALEACGISGPRTNQPGHQPRQHFDGGNSITIFLGKLEAIRNAKVRHEPLPVDYVNGFCFMLKRDRVVPSTVPFFCGHKNYGGEDVYQELMRREGHKAYVADSYVYHFKDVTMESWKEGRLALKDLAPRLKEKPRSRSSSGPGEHRRQGKGSAEEVAKHGKSIEPDGGGQGSDAVVPDVDMESGTPRA